MIYAQAISSAGVLAQQQIAQVLSEGLTNRFTGQRVLVLIPDHTRTLPLPELFRMVVEILHDVRQLDFMVALGTHPALPEEALNRLVGITAAERATKYAGIGIFNHAWDDPDALVSLGMMSMNEVQHIAGARWHPSLPSEVDIRINKLAVQYEQIIILGPTFPHEVVGFSGGAKYLFPGISGPEMINATHWLGALASVIGTIGIKHTPVRAMIHAAAERLPTAVTLVGLVVSGHDLAGIFIGDLVEAWSQAADFSAQRNIRRFDKPFQRVLAWAPPIYDELWTAAKAMYKLEPVLAKGGELIIYAPHLEVVSHVHGKYIHEVGYHILPYFLDNWEHFKHVPLGVLAHSTHVRGSGVMENGIEKPNVRVTLASKLSAQECARLNLGYLDPAAIHLEEWKDQEDQGILYVPRAGEILYRLKNQRV
jgi:nickel-dependent lactate racemase